MATVNVNFSTIYSSEFGTWNLTAPSTVNVNQGDSVVFTWFNHDGANEPTALSLSGMSSAVWPTPSGTINSPGASITRNVFNGATIGTDQIVVSATSGSYPSRTVNIVVSSSTDTTPDAFDFGNTLTNVETSTLVESPIITITGINSATSVTVTSGASFRVNGGSWVTSGTITNGQTLQVRRTSSSAYNTTLNTTVNVGGVTDTWSMRTRAAPSPATFVSLGISSGQISVDDIGDFFGRFNQFSQTELDDYRRGGIYVPDIAANSGIPTSGNLQLTDFYGSGTEFFWDKLPTTKATSHDSSTSGATLTLGWSTLEVPITASDFYVGFGEGLRAVTEYRYSHTGSAEMYIGSGTSWSTSKNQVALRVVVPQGMAEQQISGTITFEARFMGVVITTQCDYNFFIYGE